MTDYDLCFAWNSEHDADFVILLNRTCQVAGLSLLQITPDNLEQAAQLLADNRITFRALFDRASDADPRFLSMVQWARHHAVYRINPHELAVRAWDKWAMHWALSRTLHTPYTIFLPSYDEQPDLPPIDLAPLGAGFAIKPAHGGGGNGVVVGADSMDQVLMARRAYPGDRYLLQRHVVPVQLGTRPAWFRIIYCAGHVFPCWWDLRSHIYTPITGLEERCYQLTPLRSITTTIASNCRLELFSTEIALTSDGHFVVVDYVNDPIDLRLQSRIAEGVPDDIVKAVAKRLVELVADRRPQYRYRSSPSGPDRYPWFDKHAKLV